MKNALSHFPFETSITSWNALMDHGWLAENGGITAGIYSNGNSSHVLLKAIHSVVASPVNPSKATGRHWHFMTDRYVELHSASAFSFLEGASLPEALIQRAFELDMPAIALLDRNGVYGSAQFHMSAKLNNIRAHVGVEIAVSSFEPRLTPPSWVPHRHLAEPARLPLLCESRTGYQNLCQLVTKFKMRELGKAEGAATLDDLRQFASGLVCLTGGEEGILAAALAKGGEEAGRAFVEQMVRIFGKDGVYVEVQRHQEREEEWRNQAAVRIARLLRLPILATNGCAMQDRTIAKSSISSPQFGIGPTSTFRGVFCH